MIKIHIKKQDVITNSATFASQEEADTWLASCEANESFGKPEHQIQLTPEVVAEDGTITPATFQTVESEYVVEILDITQQVAQNKINQESLQYLADTDWLCLRAQEDATKPVPDDVKAKRAAARAAIVR